MNQRISMLRHPRHAGVACAIAATGLGLVYMTAAGAPSFNLAVNALALVMGLAVLALVPASADAPSHFGWVVVVLGALVLVTALTGVTVEGASRWSRIGPLAVQTSLIVVPALLVGFARRRGLLATAGVVVAAVALAMQPDRAMAGVMASALAVLALHRRDRWVASALMVAVAAFAVTLLRADTLPAVPYVDQIFYTAFAVHAAIGIGVVAGALLLVVPAVSCYRLDPASRHVYAVFGTTWLCIAVAAALGNYPTPLVGYGASAVLGYMLSLAALPRAVGAVAANVAHAGRSPAGGDDRVHPLCMRHPQPAGNR